MAFLKDLFKSKPGGTLVGNLLRTGAKVAQSAASALPVVGSVVSKLPIGQGLMMKQPAPVQAAAVQSIVKAATLPALPRAEALPVASAAKQNILALTGDAVLADKVGQATFEAASAPAVKLQDLDKVLAEVTSAVVTEKPASEAAAASTTAQKESVKEIITKVATGALNGAKSGAIDAFTETKTGKELEKDTIMVYVNKYAPLAAVGTILYLLWKRK